jgi:hypothetical protein
MPTQECRLWTEISQKVGVIRFQILHSLMALEYELRNPCYDGFVVHGYASNTLPDDLTFLNLFKRIVEERDIIILSLSRSIYK